ncbi:transmembrane transcriptional regulator (anti-sigma factor) [Candidatus Magnetobacterium bavaricum]|uniref:Transmembrane transcriptional regulator (Anti-sigma factor) n=1 Tax=Candidatus Magnetobacterium bavaricum TaxID=29290 RepID=A0A0F3H1K7_9BACT|nr:transmembrane transcriptional regulator (anti-sigma factor) [Candidatus Magnetobacterium bavaricum]
MDCKQARMTLCSLKYHETEVVSNNIVEARRHIKACRECMEFIDGERRFVTLVRDSAGKEDIPERLKSRILDMGKPKKKTFIGLYRGIAAAASIIVLLIVGYLVKTHKEDMSFLNTIVEEHVKFMPLPKTHIDSSNPEDVVRWFRGKVDFQASTITLKAILKGGRLCNIGKRKTALLFYEYGNVPLSLFIAKGQASYKLKTMKEVVVNGKKMSVGHIDEYTVVIWQDRGLAYHLVSELEVIALKEII